LPALYPDPSLPSPKYSALSVVSGFFVFRDLRGFFPTLVCFSFSFLFIMSQSSSFDLLGFRAPLCRADEGFFRFSSLKRTFSVFYFPILISCFRRLSSNLSRLPPLLSFSSAPFRVYFQLGAFVPLHPPDPFSSVAVCFFRFKQISPCAGSFPAVPFSCLSLGQSERVDIFLLFSSLHFFFCGSSPMTESFDMGPQAFLTPQPSVL